MRKRWIILGEEKNYMKSIFDISDSEIDQVKNFMEEEYENIPNLMKKLLKSNLNERQKVLCGYIMGNTVGFSMVHDVRNAVEEKRSEIDTHMAG